MPEPGLILWLLGLPFLLAIIELIRTYGLIRNSTQRERGAWSRATLIGGGGAAGAGRPSTAASTAGRSASGPASAGRPSTLAPGLR